MMEPEGRRGFGGSSLLLPVVALVVLIAIIALVAVLCTGGGSDDEAPSATPTPEVTATVPAGSAQESAIVQHLQTTQQGEYAGPCADADPTADVGKVCSAYLGERESIHAFVIGPTFSEGTEWVFVEQQGDSWRVVEAKRITPESAAVPGIPWPLAVGAEVVIVGTGSCLNVRTEPGGDAVDCITDGTTIVLGAGPQEARELQWWRVEGRDGWVAADYLRYPDATTDPEPPPTQAPADDGTPEATPAP
jgi:hypothetical protein